MPSKSNSPSDPYTYPDSTVLVNLSDIRDQEQVERFEAKAVYFRLVDLMLQPITGKFDIDHLKAIHRYLFQDVYAWAGQFRTVDISKGFTQN
jgi:cell filamentation protein